MNPQFTTALVQALRTVVEAESDRDEESRNFSALRLAYFSTLIDRATAIPDAPFDPAANGIDPRFEIGNPTADPNRVYVLVDGLFDVTIIRTDRGIILDVYPADGGDHVNTMTVWEDDLLPDEDAA